MSYDVRLMPQAQKDLESIKGKFLARFEGEILSLYDNLRPRNSKKLSGGGSRWRVRTGDYRILYEIDEQRKKDCKDIQDCPPERSLPVINTKRHKKIPRNRFLFTYPPATDLKLL